MAMNERERLIELLETDMSGCDGGYYEEMADFLLSHGVIVPPVKVGDTVYVVYEDEVFEGEIESFTREKTSFKT